MDAERFAPSQHELRGADAHVQGPAETRPAQQANAFPDAKAEGHQALVEFGAGVEGQYGSAFAWVEPIQGQRGCNRCHVALE